MMEDAIKATGRMRLEAGAEAAASILMSGGRAGMFSRERDSLLYKLEAEEIDVNFKKLGNNA